MGSILNWLISLFSGIIGVPSSIDLELVAQVSRKNWKVSSVHALNDGAILLAVYDNASRKDAWLYVIKNDGSTAQILKTSAETYGYGDRVDDWIYVPAEHKNGHIVRVNVNSHSAEVLTLTQPQEYASRQIEGVAAYIPRGNSKSNILFDMTNGQVLPISFNGLDGIVTGIVKKDDEWILVGLDTKVQSSSGWQIQHPCTEAIELLGDVLIFARNGKVYKLDGDELGDEIADTGSKPRRAVKIGRLVYWVTGYPDQIWVTNGKKSRKLHDFENTAIDPDKNGSGFNISISVDEDELIIARSKDDNGYEVFRGSV